MLHPLLRQEVSHYFITKRTQRVAIRPLPFFLVSCDVTDERKSVPAEERGGLYNLWSFLHAISVFFQHVVFYFVLFTIQVRWFYLRHEVEDHLKKEMGPKEILMCDAESDQDLSTVSQKVSKSTHISLCCQNTPLGSVRKTGV